MNYPRHILPCVEQKKIVNNLNDFFLIREIKNPDDDIIDPETGLIYERYIADPTKRIVDFSTSLLGIFTIEDLKIELTGKGKEIYAKDCEPNHTVENIPIYNEHFYIKEHIAYFFLKIGDLNGLIIPYNDFDVEKNGKCIVAHTPFIWNYWHFSLNWSKEDGSILKNIDKELRRSPERSICSVARKLIRMNAIYKKDIVKNIIPSDYYKN